jgi:hypothetical protein
MSRTPRLLPCLVAAGMAVFVVVSGCRSDAANGADPVGALRASEISRRYDVAFWADQQHRQTPAWRAGWTFCRGRSESVYPNCASIRLVGWIESPPPSPKIELPSFLGAGVEP